MKILILCTGNSCRSQMAQGFLQSFDDRLTVRSAGTVPAAQINPMAVEVMKERGIDISGNTPHNVLEYIDEPWDYVITVCDDANETCPVFLGSVKNRLHMGFETEQGHRKRTFIRSEFYRVCDQIRERFYDLYTREIKEKI